MKVAYYRTSAAGQSVEAQRHAMGGGFTMEFKDEAVSGGLPAMERPGFASMVATFQAMQAVKPELHVYAIDRLGRDDIDVKQTVQKLRDMGVVVVVRGLGTIDGTPSGALILAVLAAVAEFEKARINERTASGREAARKAFAVDGKTHKGKTSLGGRPAKHTALQVATWRAENNASIAETAKHFQIHTSAVSRFCQKAGYSREAGGWVKPQQGQTPAA